MSYLRSVYHQNRSVGGRHAGAMHLARREVELELDAALSKLDTTT